MRDEGASPVLLKRPRDAPYFSPDASQRVSTPPAPSPLRTRAGTTYGQAAAKNLRSPDVRTPTVGLTRLNLPPLRPRQFPAKVGVHREGNREGKLDNWAIGKEPGTDTLILGTSNMARVTLKPRQDLEIRSYPGGRFEHMVHMLKKSPVQEGPRRVVIAMGINDATSRAPIHSIEALVTKTAALAKQKFPHSRVYMAEINHTHLMSDDKLLRTKAINKAIRELNGVRTLSPLAPREVVIDPKDRYGVHWTANTANAIICHWVKHLN